MAIALYANLPQIVEVLSRDDYGEYGAAACPHCGALGRYVYFFRCDDGTERGAMSECFKKFPRHPFADRLAAALKKEQEAKQKGRSLASWDRQAIGAIRAYGHGELTEAEAQTRIRQADGAKKTWMQQRGYRR